MVKAEFPIGKTQWAKWGDEAREAYNHMRRLGFTHETGMAEADAVQTKARKAALQELADLGQEQDAPLPEPEESAPKKPVIDLKPRTVKRKQGK